MSQSEKSEQNSADKEHFLIYPASEGLNGFLVSKYKLNFLVWEKKGAGRLEPVDSNQDLPLTPLSPSISHSFGALNTTIHK